MVITLGSPAIQVFIECIAGSKYMNTSLPRQFASCTREGLVFTGMHKSRYESSLHLICFLPRIKRGTTSTGMTKYHCLLNINNINKLIMQNSVANWKLKGIPSQKTGFFSYVIEGYSLIKSVWFFIMVENLGEKRGKLYISRNSCNPKTWSNSISFDPKTLSHSISHNPKMRIRSISWNPKCEGD